MVNTTAAIMAIPSPLEPIRLVGDGDKHATLLFFGETSTLPAEAKQNLVEAVKLASSMLFPFGEPVVDVSRLGNDVPPALVAQLAGENLRQVRNLFLMNPTAKGYLDNTPQFPSFTPHVTLGFPDFTDEVVLRSLMQQIYRVRFDRLAVWWNDENIEYDLNQAEDSMAMSEAIGAFLEHHGTKGMKWGVRKDQLGLSEITPGAHKGDKGSIAVVQRHDPKAPGAAPSKADIKTLSKATTQARDGALGKKSLDSVDALNKAVMKDLDAKKYEWNSAAHKKYESLVASHMEEGAKANIKAKDITAWCRPLGKNTFMLHVGHPEAIANFKKDNNLSHSVMSGVSTTLISADTNALGLVVGFRAGATSLAHADSVESILSSIVEVEEGDAEHHGIRGQKWGVRRQKDSATGRVEQTGTTGLKPRTGSADQISQDRIAKKIKTGGTQSLSNADIQAYSRRLQLKKDLDKVLTDQSAQEKARADGFIKSFIKKQGGRQVDRVVNKALDVAVESALKQAGLKMESKNPELGKGVQEVAKRLGPKKK